MDGMWDQRRRIVPRFFIWLFVPQPPVSTPPPSSSWLIQGCRQERKPRHNHACCHTSQRRGGAGRIIDDRGGSRLVGHRTTRSRDGLEIGTLSLIQVPLLGVLAHEGATHILSGETSNVGVGECDSNSSSSVTATDGTCSGPQRRGAVGIQTTRFSCLILNELTSVAVDAISKVRVVSNLITTHWIDGWIVECDDCQKVVGLETNVYIHLARCNDVYIPLSLGEKATPSGQTKQD